MSRTIRVQTRKWPDDPHWEFDAIRLGVDGHGHWVGLLKGTWLSRPGAGFHAQCDQVVLIPYDEWWVATFYGDDDDRPVDIYVDIATPAQWDEPSGVVKAVDLDLDVIRGPSGRVWVDDEDEFADHQVQLGYPTDVIDAAMQSCETVLAAVTDRATPFDETTSAGWLARLRSL
ncbi:MAG: hypothetical protein JWR35_1408 [Marmoricola sp.]|nr:hypothetical protein [Marmoricola sp.]